MNNKYAIGTNYKYLSKNYISKYLVNNFNEVIKLILSDIKFKNYLDIGCGEGVILSILKTQIKDKNCYGIDIDQNHIEKAKFNAPFCHYKIGDIYKIPFSKNSYDLVTCFEVLEHLEYPHKAIKELKRVSSKYNLISVPREPLWCMLNMIRGKYWKGLGNTPGHINNWSTKDIVNLLSNYFQIVKIYKPIPWTIILAKS
ncbi:MAG: class I SAM-dependent methyltransferase [Candidatus Marinimicrobia bacterium]|nr:class I SAM-dependent methyltransferase [Candidatus Neomarinimicrobiota bacterium]